MAILLSLLACAVARADEGADHVKVDLLADTTAVQPGKPFTLGVRFKIDPGWHIYWTNPGDSGLPTRVKLDLPAGFKAGEVQYPIPAVLKLPGDITNYGYEGEVMFLTTVTPPVAAATGDAAVKVRSDYLVCSENCLPGSATASLSLPWAKQRSPANSELFDTWRSRLPQTPRLWLSQQTGQPNDDTIGIGFGSDFDAAHPDTSRNSLIVTWSPSLRTGLTNLQWLPPAVPDCEFSEITISTDKDGSTTVVRYRITADGGHKLPDCEVAGLLEYTRADRKRAGVLTPIANLRRFVEGVGAGSNRN